MTMRLMPTTSHWDRTLAPDILSHHPLLLLKGVDRCGKNDFEKVEGLVPKIT